LAFDVIAKVGHDGHFLGEEHTLERCRTEFWQPQLANRNGLATWSKNGKRDVTNFAHNRWQELLAQYVDPPIDEIFARQLKSYLDESIH
jgi:trimethylamine--corrinoid protein Co-methyltransferase